VSSDLITLYIFTFIFGAVIGSFLNVCIYRLPREESIVFPPSHCTSCGSGIKFYHNIPIIGFLLLRGKCATCKEGISFMYPFVEFLAGALFLGTLFSFGLTLHTLFYTAFIFSLIVITFIDLEHLIIPNVISYPGILVGLIFNALITDWPLAGKAIDYLRADYSSILAVIVQVPILDSLFGVILGGGILLLIAYSYEKLRGREGMGMGDVKLLAMIGAFLGIQGVVFVILVSSILGTVVGLSMILLQKGDFKYALPFGPFLSIAAVVYIFTGGFRVNL